MWALFSTFVEMTPILRSMCENIIYHSSWTGEISDFNVFLNKYNSQIDEILKKGVLFDSKLFHIKIHMIVADAPARAKACNSANFNGRFGCLKCLHPSFSKGPGVTIYPTLNKLIALQLERNNSVKQKDKRQVTTTIGPRTNEIYNKQLKSCEFGKTFEGIKGETHLSKWISIPDGVYLDKMHLCDIGTFKFIFNSFFDPKKNKNHIIWVIKGFLKFKKK